MSCFLFFSLHFHLFFFSCFLQFVIVTCFFSFVLICSSTFQFSCFFLDVAVFFYFSIFFIFSLQKHVILLPFLVFLSRGWICPFLLEDGVDPFRLRFGPANSPPGEGRANPNSPKGRVMIIIIIITITNITAISQKNIIIKLFPRTEERRQGLTLRAGVGPSFLERGWPFLL